MRRMMMEVLETRVDDLEFTKTWPHNFKNLISNPVLKKKRKNRIFRQQAKWNIYCPCVVEWKTDNKM